MASTNFCEIAARYLDMVEEDGLEAAAEMASESLHSMTYCEDDDQSEDVYCPIIDCVDFISDKLDQMCRAQWAARKPQVEVTPTPSVQFPESAATLIKIADIRAYYGAKVRKQLRHIIYRAFNNTYRITTVLDGPGNSLHTA